MSAVANIGNLGMVRQCDTLCYEGLDSNPELRSAPKDQNVRIPDFVRLAEAHGCVGLRCERPEDIDATIEKAMSIDDAPVVVDFSVNHDAMVWPMVGPGVGNDEIQYARDMAPTWEHED